MTGPTNEAGAAATLHSLTRHGEPVDRSRLVDFRPLDPANRPAPFKRYVRLRPEPLPRDFGAAEVPARLDQRLLARLLFFTAGVTRASSSPAFDERTYFRTAMSAGNLHPVEVYVVSGGLPGLDAGVYHFAPLEFGLTRLRGAERLRGVPCTLVLTGIPWRTAWKYGERGYRHLYWDAGTMLANLLAVTDAYGLPVSAEIGFVDDDVTQLAGVDDTTELPLALVRLEAANETTFPRDLEPVEAEVAPISPHPITFPLITEAQRSGALGSEEDVVAWQRRAGREEGQPAAAAVPETAFTSSIERVILRRGSTRLMRRERAPEELLREGMANAARPVPADFVRPGSTLLEHDLSVHGIDGVEPGAYRWHPDHLELVRPGDFRLLAQQLCLDQPLGGDSAYTAFHCADLGRVLGALGSRGYRAAQLEAGIAAGRLSLAAFALGDGATGLTFFDEPVRRFFRTEASCMLVTSVGVPDYRNTPGGDPGHPSELAHYAELMRRLSLQLHRSR